MKSYWPTVPSNPKSTKAELLHAKWIENVHKVVVSKTMKQADWNISTIINKNIADEIKKLKQKSVSDIGLFGRPTLSQFLSKLGLIDEYRLWINLVVLGNCIPIFKDIKKNFELKLTNKKTLNQVLLSFNIGKYKLTKWKKLNTMAKVILDMSISLDEFIAGPKDNPQELTGLVNNARKVVFSKRLKKANWNNTEIIDDIVLKDIKTMKQETGKNIVIFGSGRQTRKLSYCNYGFNFQKKQTSIKLTQDKNGSEKE